MTQTRTAGIEFHALASVDPDAPSFILNSGAFTNIVANGVGDFTVTFGAAEGLDASEGALFAKPRGNIDDGYCIVEHVDDLNKRIRVFTTGAGPVAVAADLPFDIWALRVELG